MGGCRHFKALMWKNVLLKWRNPLSSICECVLPAGFVCIMIGLYFAFSTQTYATQAFTGAWGPFSPSEDIKRVPPFSIVPARLQLANQVLAVYATDPSLNGVVTQFVGDMSALYTEFNGTTVGTVNGNLAVPALAGVYIPPLSRYIRVFPSEADFNAFVSNINYGLGSDPRIWAAIVFNKGAPGWDISYRFNFTEVPSTINAPTNNLQRGYDPTPIDQYTFNKPQRPGGPFARNQNLNPIQYQKMPGFTTLQLMVDRWIINRRADMRTMDPLQSVYSFGYMLGLASFPDRNQFAFLQQMAALTNDTAGGIVAGRIMQWMQSETYAPQTVDFVPFPIFGYTTNGFYAIASQLFAFFFVLSFLFPVSRLIRGLVQEKETKIREGMKMMGLGDASLFGSWLTTYAILYLILAIFVAIVTKNNMFKASSGGLVFLLFFLFGLSSITYCYFISVFFSRAKTASTLGVVLFLASFFPWFAVNDATYSQGAKLLASLMATTAFGLGLDQLAAFEDNGQGITPSNAAVVTRNYAFSQAIGIMFFDFLLYGVLAWYADAVLPSSLREFGVPRPWYFCCTPRYWAEVCTCCCTSSSEPSSPNAGTPLMSGSQPGGIELRTTGGASTVGSGAVASSPMRANGPAAHMIEEPDAARRAKEREGKAVSIRGLRKTFDTPDGPKAAVDGVDMSMFEGDIFVLLGHNGAGKTTTINMLTGMLPPTDGTMNVFGRDVGTNLSVIRQDLGVCPQHDVLWPELTVQEHLRLYCDIKGVPASRITQEIDDAIETVGLREKRHVASGKLSGGQKRKLSVCIALLGGSRFIVLDEPTSGMDPYSRRSTWDILRKARNGRIMLLTTHFMDEADLLGDRICIMAKGRVQCCGSPMFLKRAHGVGYLLTIVKEPLAPSQPVVDLIMSHVPEATVGSDVGAELAIRLPMATSAAFPAMFAQLDAQLRDLHCVTYGVGITTMEEVFLKVAHGSDDHAPHAAPAPKPCLPCCPAPKQAPVATTTSGSPPATPTAGASVITVGGAKSAHAHGGASYQQGETMGEPGHGSGIATAGTSGVSPTILDAPGSMAFVNPYPPPGVTVPGSAGGVRATMSKRDYNEEAKTGFGKHLRHFYAMLMKRYRISVRDSKALCYQLFIPIVMVAGGLALLRAGAITSFPEYQFSTANFNVAYNARQRGGGNVAPVPQFPNLAPFFTYKSANMTNDLAQASILSLFNRMPEANVTTNVARLQFDTANAAALDASNPWGVIAPGASYPTRDLQRMSSFLLSDKATYAGSKYGAFIPTADGTYFPGQWRNATAPSDNIVTMAIMHNTTAVHGGPLWLNLMDSALYAAYSGTQGASITARTAPLPLTKRQATVFSGIFASASAIIIVLAFSFIPASYAIYVVKEREVKAKHQQLISGVSLPAYWLSVWLFDNITYIVPGAVSVGLCAAFGVNDFVGTAAHRINALALLFWLYGMSISSFTYMVSFLFNSHSTAQNVVLFINVGAMIIMIASFIMAQVEDTCRADEVLRYIWRLLPAFNLGNGLLQLSFLELLPLLDTSCDRARGLAVTIPAPYDALDMKATGTNLAYMAAETVVYMLLTLLIDVIKSRPKVLLWCKRDPTVKDKAFVEDDDVIAERSRIDGMLADTSSRPKDIIALNNMRKVYQDGKVAVKGLSFGVPAGEVFGFLGINGAGKTTTLQMLSGDVLPSSGTAKLATFDIIDQQPQVRALLGYCPQWDALLELLTTREHLELFARIKGVPEKELNDTVNEQMRRMDLTDFANKKAGTLSGGNKRKLSVAIALIGPKNQPPPVIFLDEPSTGMDPVARRFMWRVIAEVATRDKSCSIILTTHSMEECEALCQRVGIMVGGRMRCVGSIQHLKNKFGKGYQAEIKLAEPAEQAVNHLTGEITARLQAQFGTGAAAVNGVPLIKRGQLEWISNSLEVPGRVAQISPTGAGWSIDAAFERSRLPTANLAAGSPDRAIPVQEFATWWAGEDAVFHLHTYITGQAFPGSVLKERQGSQVRYSIPEQRDPLGVLFAKIEAAKGTLGIQTYALGQTTLEQIFNHMAKDQEEETGKASGFVAAAGVAGENTQAAVATAVPVAAAPAQRAGFQQTPTSAQ